MRVTIPVALFAATLLSAQVLGQRVSVSSYNAQSIGVQGSFGPANIKSTGVRPPLLEEGITGYAMATAPLWITHITPAGREEAVEPSGTAFSKVPAGPACPHWPIYGCGVNYSIERAPHGLAYTYRGRDLVQVSPAELGRSGDHDNKIVMMTPDRVPAFVDVRIQSVVEAAFSYQTASVDLGSYGLVRHQFKAGFAETVASVPVELSPAGLELHVRSLVFVDNTREPAEAGLVDVGISVTVRLPSASYETEGAVTCAGSNGAPFLQVPGGSLPVLGTVFEVSAMNLPLDPHLPVYGLIGPTRFLPFELSSIGMPGCYLHLPSPVAVDIEKCCGIATWALPIPANLDLLGAEFYQQVFALDESWVNPLGAVITDLGHGTIGAPPIVE